MNSSMGFRRPGAFSPHPPPPNQSHQNHGPSIYEFSDSDDSTTSPVLSRPRDLSSSRSRPMPRAAIFTSPTANSSTNSINNFSRPSYARHASEQPIPRLSGEKSHRRQHSQGFFEPTLPSATISEHAAMPNLNASKAAAQAAMQHQSHASRQRSQTNPSPIDDESSNLNNSSRRKVAPAPIHTLPNNQSRRPSGSQTPGRSMFNGHPAHTQSHTSASTATSAAAAAVFPNRPSPMAAVFDTHQPSTEKDQKQRSETSKMKLFSKPKDKPKEPERERPQPSPNKSAASSSHTLAKIASPSLASLNDSLASAASSIYSVPVGNASTSTLVPDKQRTDEKEKPHKHHFLSRQKHKFKDKMGDDHSLQLSSAASNSRPSDASCSPLYSFAPSPASPASTSFTGLDLRHAGRAVREKRKEERAALPFAPKLTDLDKFDMAGSGRATPAPSLFGQASGTAGEHGNSNLQNYGLSSTRPEEAWDNLKIRLLVVFEGEELRVPIEDLNRLVTVHLQRCMKISSAVEIIDDLRELFKTGFRLLDQNLHGVPEQRIVGRLVDMWLFVFGTLLPYLQAVFLPLDLEFRGHGSLMTAQESLAFWGAAPADPSERYGSQVDVRRIILLSYRDHMILPRYQALKTTFSRLSLESLNMPASPMADSFDQLTSSGTNANRPDTANSIDASNASFTSQPSSSYEHHSVNSSSSLGSMTRSRGNSNLSASTSDHGGLSGYAASGTAATSVSGVGGAGGGSTTSGSMGGRARSQSQQQISERSARVTQTVGRMLQCVSVLASAQSGDDAQNKMEELSKTLKLNWLGRGRVGRNRKGFVGARTGIAPPVGRSAGMLGRDFGVIASASAAVG